MSAPENQPAEIAAGLTPYQRHVIAHGHCAIGGDCACVSPDRYILRARGLVERTGYALTSLGYAVRDAILAARFLDGAA